MQVYLGVDPVSGRKRYRSEAVPGTRPQAERRLTELLREIDTAGSLPEPTDMTVAEYLELWLRDHMESQVRLRTLEGYRQHVRGKIVPRIGRVSLRRLTPLQVQEMEAELLRSGGQSGGKLSPRTVLQTHRILARAMKYAMRMGLVSRDVVAPVEPPRISRHEVRSLSWDECRQFLAEVDDPLFQTLFLLALHTGLRRSEMVGLQWRDIDLQGGFLSVQRALVKLPSGGVDIGEPKSGLGRMLDLPEAALEALRSHRESPRGNGNFVFCRPGGGHLDPNLVTRVFKRTALRAGLDGVRFHDLRHTHASLLLAEGVHLKVVSERLGHSSIAITADIYSHVLPTVQRSAAERFGEAWRESGRTGPEGGSA